MPSWFAALVRPQLVGRAVRVVALEGANPVIIVGEPADEIAEAWHDFFSLAIVWLALNALILAVLYIVLGRLLDPLAHLSKGMLRLEDGYYATRLPLPRSRSSPSSPGASTRLLAHSTPRAMRTAGFTASSSPCRRRSGARSPTSCTTRPVPACSASPPMPRPSKILPTNFPIDAAPRFPGASARFSYHERLKLLNRALLKKLKPAPLGRVKLAELLDELIAGFQRRHPDTQIAVAIGKLANSYGEASISPSIAAFRKASPMPSAMARRRRSPSISPRPRRWAAVAPGSSAPRWRSS